MGGYLVFAKEFIPPTEEELTRIPAQFGEVDSVTWDVGYSELERMKCLCEEHGVPRDYWPDYIDVDGHAAVISLDELGEKNRKLKDALSRLPDEVIAQEQSLGTIIDEFKSGRILFITH